MNYLAHFNVMRIIDFFIFTYSLNKQMHIKTLLSVALASTGILSTNAALAGTSVEANATYQQAPWVPAGVALHNVEQDFNTARVVRSEFSQVIDNGTRTASAWARFDPSTGSFKALTNAASNSASGGATSAWTYAALGDSLRINSSATTATLNFTINYDSRFNVDPISGATVWTDGALRTTESNFSIGASHTVVVANPCDECSSSRVEYLGGQSGSVHALAMRSNPQDNNGSAVNYVSVQNFSGLGRTESISSPGLIGAWHGTLSYSMVVPTNEDISLDVNFSTTSSCTHADSCLSSNDSSHSFYLGLTAVGGTLVSQNGYGYTLGVSAVPEPESYAMLLAGLGLLGFAARRAKRA
jgi:hypothetical protein